MTNLASPTAHFHGRELRAGFIFEVACAAGIEVTFEGVKQPLCCPFHNDTLASAFLSPNNIFYCSVCTPGQGWPAKRFALELGVDWTAALKGVPAVRAAPSNVPQPPRAVFTAEMALGVWRAALARARDDEHVEEDRAVYEYLDRRGLLESWEISSFGILAPGMHLPPSIASWPAHGYRVVAPLYDMRGNLTNVQARAIRDTWPKTRFPDGSQVKGTVFADARGHAVLRGERAGEDVLVGEGLTDFLALSITSPIPVICVPGTGIVQSAIGEWVRGRRIHLVLDCDATGDAAAEAASNAAKKNGASDVLRHRWPAGCKDACEVVAAQGVASLSEHLTLITDGGPR